MFTHLHIHSSYSLLDSSIKIKEYVNKIKENGMTAAAITDHGAMYGVVDFYKYAKEQGINPILGCEVYVAPKSRFEKNKEERYFHLVLLAENNTGYNNLMKIVSKGFTEGFYYKPRIDKQLLKQYHEGIIALSACLAGEIPHYIVNDEIEHAEEVLQEYLDIFGKDNFYLEIQDHGIPEEKKVITGILNMSKKYSIPIVATNDSHYVNAEDAEPHDVMLCIQTGKKIDDSNRMKYEGGQYYVKTEQEMRELFPYIPEAIENTQKVADRCHVELEFGVTKVPTYDVPEGYTTWTYLNKLCEDGLKMRYPGDDGKIMERMKYELSVIHKMGYVEYFLIVWDYINWCRENDIPVGPGRGSAAGSIVSYCIGITNIDPIKYNLLFERFLNPERVSMPDIDVDFCYERRQEVIDYVSKKYGTENVVQIITFGTMAAKAVIKDVGKVMNIPYSVTNELSKMVPSEVNMTLDKALEMSPDLKSKYDNDMEIRDLINICKKLEGMPKQTGTHAAGVIICQKAADEFVPLAISADGNGVVSQFTMTTVEELGLLKMDFLGLRTLTVIQKTIKEVMKNHHVNIDIEQINYNDIDVLDFISTGKTDGVFQIESDGMKSFMKKLKPKTLEDLIAGISLYRPGPMDFIPKYIAGKNNPETITYECPELEPILSPTYGCIVYQEQVMQIVQELAGYTMGQADNIRRAMSKKKQYVIDEERKSFIYGDNNRNIKGCVNNGISEEAANNIYDSMVDFAKYAFNKSHAACYAVISFQTAWLKYYYPIEYMAALMTSVVDNPDKLTGYIMATRDINIEILPPSIEESTDVFTVINKKILFPLNGIKNIGVASVKEFIQKRQIADITNLRSVLETLVSCQINKAGVENLIKAGAFDRYGYRSQLLSVYEMVINSITTQKKKNIQGQMNLFELMDNKEMTTITLPQIPEFNKQTIYEYEKEVSNVYISGHPLDEYRELLYTSCDGFAKDLIYDNEAKKIAINVEDKKEYLFAGIITKIKISYTKKNDMMAFATVEDVTGTYEVIVFPKVYATYRSLLEEGSKVFIKGYVSEDDESNAKMLVNKIININASKKVWIRISSSDDKINCLNYIKEHAREGIDNICIYAESEKKVFKIPNQINADNQLLKELVTIYGVDNVKTSILE